MEISGKTWDEIASYFYSTDLFTIFGLPAKYDIDEQALANAYRVLLRNIHPDCLRDKSAQAFSLQASAMINSAYTTLKDAALRAEYLLKKAGGKSSSEDNQVPDGLFLEVMMIWEELNNARLMNDSGTILRIKRDTVLHRDEIERKIAQLCACLESGEEVKSLLRMELNAMKYYSNLVNELD